MSLPPFDLVLDEHGPAVRRLLARLLGPVEADDAWQDTFIAALHAYPRLRPDSDIRAWLLTIAHRKAIDRFRVRARQPVPEPLPPAGRPRSAGPATDPASAVADTVDARSELWARVRRLPDKQRLAVGYRFAADMSYADIASQLDCTETAARRSVFEGLRTLRGRLVPSAGRPPTDTRSRANEEFR